MARSKFNIYISGTEDKKDDAHLSANTNRNTFSIPRGLVCLSCIPYRSGSNITYIRICPLASTILFGELRFVQTPHTTQLNTPEFTKCEELSREGMFDCVDSKFTKRVLMCLARITIRIRIWNVFPPLCIYVYVCTPHSRTLNGVIFAIYWMSEFCAKEQNQNEHKSGIASFVSQEYRKRVCDWSGRRKD